MAILFLKIFFMTMSAQGGGGDPAFLSLETNLESGTAPPQIMIRNQGTGGYGFFGDKGNGLGVFDIDQGIDHLQSRIDPAAKGIHFNHDDSVRGIGYVIQCSFQKRRHTRLDIA